jgi:hypothetical protein
MKEYLALVFCCFFPLPSPSQNDIVGNCLVDSSCDAWAYVPWNAQSNRSHRGLCCRCVYSCALYSARGSVSLSLRATERWGKDATITLFFCCCIFALRRFLGRLSHLKPVCLRLPTVLKLCPALLLPEASSSHSIVPLHCFVHWSSAG